jgi:hypothetical protein
MMYWEVCGKKRSRRNLYPGGTGGTEKIYENLNHDSRDFNSGPPEYEAGVLTKADKNRTEQAAKLACLHTYTRNQIFVNITEKQNFSVYKSTICLE